MCAVTCRIWFVTPVKRTIPHVMKRMTATRIAVARFELMSRTPIFAKIAVNAAKTAESNAQIRQSMIS